MPISIATNIRHKTERTDVLQGKITGFSQFLGTSQGIAIPVAARKIEWVGISTLGGTEQTFVNDASTLAFTVTFANTSAPADLYFVVEYVRGTGATLTIDQTSSSPVTTTTTTTTTT